MANPSTLSDEEKNKIKNQRITAGAVVGGVSAAAFVLGLAFLPFAPVALTVLAVLGAVGLLTSAAIFGVSAPYLRVGVAYRPAVAVRTVHHSPVPVVGIPTVSHRPVAVVQPAPVRVHPAPVRHPVAVVHPGARAHVSPGVAVRKGGLRFGKC